MDTTPLGRELRSARDRAGLTLAQLAERTGVPLTTIHGMENGNIRYPTERVLRPVANALEPLTSYRRLALAVYGETVEAEDVDKAVLVSA